MRYALLFALLLSLAACGGSRELRDTRHALEREYGRQRLDHTLTLSLGPVSLLAARLFTGLAPRDARPWRPYLRHLYRVEVSTYELDGAARTSFDPLRLPALRRGGWQTAVRVRDGDEHMWLLYRGTPRTVDDFYMLAVSDGELVLARARGRFDRVLRQLVHDRGALDLDGLDEAFRDD